MSKSSRRVLQTTVAVVGMAAVGAVGSGTAFAQTATDLDRATEGAGQADLAGVEDGLGTPDQVGGVDLHSFQVPSLGDQSVKNSHHLAKKKDKDSDDGDSDDKDKKDSDKDGKGKKKSDKDDDGKGGKGGKHRKKD